MTELNHPKGVWERRKEVQIVDCREPYEWSAGRIEGALHVPLNAILAGPVDGLDPKKPVVVVCRSGNRSAQGRDILLAAGYPSVTSMAGGMNDWTAAGYETATGS